MIRIANRLPVRIDISWLKSRLDSPSDQAAFSDVPEHELTERARLVARILELNPTASSDFLHAFGIDDLAAYLDHLNSATRPRGRMARWIRPDNTSGFAMSDARD
jgi:hypothetical protein